MPDWYGLLGVEPDADADELRRAYRRQALTHHPDMGGDTAAFVELKAAYDILADPAARAAYDAGADGAGMPGATPGSQPRRWARASDTRGGEKGADVAVDVDVEQKTAIFGGTVEVRRNRYEPCPVCDGTGDGEGRTGQCLRCEGECRVVRYVTHEVPVSARVADGDELKLPGMGDAGAPSVDGTGRRTTGCGICGALIVRFHPLPGDVYAERGNDLISAATISSYDAMLGTTSTVELLDGPARLSVPAGIQHGQRLRIRGRGAPLAGGEGRGDAQIEVHIDTVVDLETQERAILEELRARRLRRNASGPTPPG